jgi:hypothetical protein
VLVALSLSPGGGYIVIETGQGFGGVMSTKTNMLLVPEWPIVPRLLIHRPQRGTILEWPAKFHDPKYVVGRIF